MKNNLIGLFILGLLYPFVGSAQVLTTAETGGKGNQGAMITANGLYPQGLTLFNAYGMYAIGATRNIDVLATYGAISAEGSTQHYAGLGWNITLARRNWAMVDVSFFNIVTIPLNHRWNASTVLMNPALVVSRPLPIKRIAVTAYSGISFLVPVGQVRDKLFTPPETFVTVPMGISLGTGKNIFYIEGDPGTNLKTAGIGVLRVF